MTLPKSIEKRIRLTRPKDTPEPIPTLEESFTDEYVNRLEELLFLYVHNKQLVAGAQEAIDALKPEILAMMDEAEVLVFQHKSLKWKKRNGSRPTISREALILAGVEENIVNKATKVSKFWVLDMDALDEAQLRG